MAESNDSGVANRIQVIILGALGAGVLLCVWMISIGDLSNRESALIGVLLTILSVLASWYLTHLYSSSQYKSAIQDVKEEHKSNLRTYALKAAEKVNNLSNELNRLSIYLEEELSYTEYRTTEEELLAKEERMESAIHLIRTLKSVNDTGLSDWEGVIGDELDQRREEQEEREQELRILIGRIETFLADNQRSSGHDYSDHSDVRSEIDAFKHELRLALFQLSDSAIPKRIRKREPKKEVNVECPECSSKLSYRQRTSSRSVKSISCKACGTKLVSKYIDGTGFVISRRRLEDVPVNCPVCNASGSVSVENVPGANVSVACLSCGEPFRVVRSGDNSIVVKALSSSMPSKISENASPLTEDIIQKVKGSLPAQPWPTGTHKEVASKLGISHAMTRRAIDALIERGDFQHQVNGAIIGQRQ